MAEEDPVVTALEARLEALQQEVDRLTRLAPDEHDDCLRQQYWDLARDTQAEVRKLRSEFSGRLTSSGKEKARSLFARLFSAFKMDLREA